MPLEPPPLPDVILWSRLRRDWPALPLRDRRAYLAAAAERLHEHWTAGASLASLALGLLAFQRLNGSVTARWSEPELPQVRRPAPPMVVLNVLAGWHIQVRDVMSSRDALYFLKTFLRGEQMDIPARRHAIRTVLGLAARQVRDRAYGLYQLHLEEENPSRDDVRCEWQPDPSVAADTLRGIVEAIERDPSTHYLKNNPIIRVMRANVLGYDTLIKRYDLPSWTDRVKYRFRESRARRAWAAGRTLLSLGISTPEPLGFLEIYEGRVATRSYVFTVFMADAVPTYAWIKSHYRHRPPEWRERFSLDLMHSLLSLYDRGIYHADTKTSNVLMTHPDDPAKRAFHWIDLECVEAGVTPSRAKIIRNLVQLNGSFRHWVPESERLAFLHALARYYPWLDNPRIIEKIRRWTVKRWRNEIEKHIGP